MSFVATKITTGWMTFCPELVDGSPNLDGSTFSLFWIYLVFMNGLWVVLPLLLLYDSFSRLSTVVKESQTKYRIDDGTPVGGPSRTLFIFCAALIVLYMVLVPLVLFTAEGVQVQ